MTLKAVCFDIDGTLYPERKLYMRSLGPVMRRPRLAYAYSRARKRLREQQTYALPLREQQARLVLEELGKGSTPRRLSRISAGIESSFYGTWNRVFTNIQPFPGTAEALRQLQNSGLMIGALSDFPVGRKLKVLGIDQFFSAALCSEDSGYLKPSAVPFLYAAEQMGYHPGEILFIGNSLSKDILGARKAGMRAAYFSRRVKRLRYRSKSGISAEIDVSERTAREFSQAESADNLPHFSFSHYDDLPQLTAVLAGWAEEADGNSSP